MLINEVQYKVGLTKKSIRYYESEGLLKPKRNSNNDYREYDDSDIKDLKLIKFLRNLNVPVNEIKKLKNRELTLKECINDRIRFIENTEHEFSKIKNMCYDIVNSNLEFDNIDITKYSEEMNIINKRGVALKDFKKKDHRKILGACLSSLIFSLFFLTFIILFTVILFTDTEFPIILYIIIVSIFGFPIFGIIINLIKRIKDNKNIRQINISLHSFDEIYDKSLEDYLEDIFGSVDNLIDNHTIVTYRMWVGSPYKNLIIKRLEEKYATLIGDRIKVKLGDTIYYEVEKEFIWPSYANSYTNCNGSCRGTRDFIGILVNGDVVPCCLDSEGIIKLGNIYKDNIRDIIKNNLFKEMKKGFMNNHKYHDLCKKCNFYDLRRE